MTAGLSGSYGFNGVNLTLQPTMGKWIDRPNYGIDGGGHVIYSSLHQFELDFDLANMVDFNQLLSAYNAVANTGTVVCDLPQFSALDDRFYSYSGCTLQEPTFDNFFMGYAQTVKLIILNIFAQ
jgi:hypothetical protein